MKKFIVSLFSNRFGIVLAALNVCYLVSRENINTYTLGDFFIRVNFPAIFTTIFTMKLVKLLTGAVSETQSAVLLGDFLFCVFLVLQWLFIAWIAKTLAENIQRRKL